MSEMGQAEWTKTRMLRLTRERSRRYALVVRGSVKLEPEAMLSSIRHFVSRSPAFAIARRVLGTYRRQKYERKIARFLRERTGLADRLPQGAVFEGTMRCNLHCGFCWVGDLLNLEGEWREELPLDALRSAFPDKVGFQINLTGGEIFMRKDIFDVLDLFKGKGYSCGYITTNGTIIDDERADALAALAQSGFLKHVSVSVDGPKDIHDEARGVKGTFERTAVGLRRLQEAIKRNGGARLPISINTTVTQEGLGALDEMVDVAEELGVDAIGLNHLMYSTPEEVNETLRLLGEDDPAVIQTYVTPDPGLRPESVRQKVLSLADKCQHASIRFGARPQISDAVLDQYYEPGGRVEGRCLYPFLNARVSFSGKVYFCPMIRVEVGDLTKNSMEEIWNNERYVELRRRLLDNTLFPVCQRCCKVELSPERAIQPDTLQIES